MAPSNDAVPRFCRTSSGTLLMVLEEIMLLRFINSNLNKNKFD
jgi:hypothetical protein